MTRDADQPDPAQSDAAADRAKAQLRDRAHRARAEARRAAGPETAQALNRRLIALAQEFPDGPVSGYLAIGDEVDVAPCLADLAAAGRVTCLPVVAAPAAPLAFRAWRPGDDLEAGPLGTRHPAGAAPEVTPGLLIVPLLAFDRTGYRLGWGGGFYDRTLAGLRQGAGGVIAVGVGYAAQEVDAVPRDQYDEALDWIVTETMTYKVSGSGKATTL